MNIEKLKQLNVDRLLAIEEVVALSAEGRQLSGEYAVNDLEVPEWLERACATLGDEIAQRSRAGDMARIA